MLAHVQNRSDGHVLLKGFGDCRAPEIVRSEFADARLVAASFDDVPNMPGRQPLTDSEIFPGSAAFLRIISFLKNCFF